MPDIQLSEINWIAVIVASLATFFLGALWYTALFGKKWQALHGFTDEQMKAMQATTPPAVFFSVLLVSYLIVATVLAIIIEAAGANGAAGGAVIGFLCWIGFAAAIGMTGHIASGKHIGIYLIDTAYQLIYLVLSGLILGAWR